MRPWLRLFRVVNLPTVPGDVLVGAAAAIASGGCASASAHDMGHVALVAVASCFLYLFGLAHNDIVGAATDKNRPIPDGEISLSAARIACGICLAFALAFVVVGGAHLAFAKAVAFTLVLVIMIYNHTKRPLLMGLCRGLNVLFGAAATYPLSSLRIELSHRPLSVIAPLAVALVWTAYIAGVTKYSEGEESDPARKRRVGFLIGGIVYLQIIALVVCALFNRAVNPLLVAGAVLLVVLRVVKMLFPKVSAS